MPLIREFRFAVRSLFKSPVFTIVAVLSLALGIGANTAVFTFLDQALLRLLPVKDADQLVQLKEAGEHYGSNTGINALSYPIYKDFSEKNQVFSGMFCRSSQPFSVSFGTRNERTSGELVTGTYFPVLGIKPALGRLFTASDDQTRGGASVAVLGYDYWQTRFAGNADVIGKSLLVNNHKLTIIGIAQKGFAGVEPLFTVQVYVPMAMAEQITKEDKPFDNRRRRWVQVFARLKPGVTPMQAKASLQPIFHSILEMEAQQPAFAHASAYSREQFLRMRLDVMPGGRGQSVAREFLEAPLWAMMAMVSLVLLIACANVANLIIARAASRQREIAVRLALGASRGRIAGQLLSESLILAFTGGALGLIVSAWTMRLLVGIMPHVDPPIRLDTNPDLRVLCFSLIVSVATALIFGLLPALQATRTELAPTLKDQANAVAGGGQARWRKLLVSFQVALSLLLLIGAGLFVGTLRNLKSVNPGFDINNLISFSLDPTLSGYDAKRANLFYKQLSQNLSALPGVQSAALCVVAPLSFGEWDSSITVEGYTSKPGEDMNPLLNYVSPAFFTTFKIPLYAGRDFTDKDTIGAPKVAIVNEKFARHFFGNASAAGRRIGMGGDPGTKTDIEIIGVVGDTKYQTMRQDAPREMYFPYQQNDWATAMTAYVRTDAGSAQMFPALRNLVRKEDARLPIFEMKTEERQLDDVLAIERLAASLSSGFGLLAAILAAIGLYGVLAFVVARRTREIGIRMALGAATMDVLWIVMREILLMVGIGVAVGLPAALGISNLVRSQFYGMSPSDPTIIVLAIFGIAAIAVVSGYLPARRATRVEPVTALRYE